MLPFYEACQQAQRVSGVRIKVEDLPVLYQEWYKLALQAAFTDPVFR